MVGSQYDDKCCVTCGETIYQVLDHYRASLMRRASFEVSDLPRSTDLRLSGDESDGQRIRAEDSVIDLKPTNLHSCHTSHLRLVRGVTRAQARSWRNG